MCLTFKRLSNPTLNACSLTRCVPTVVRRRRSFYRVPTASVSSTAVPSVSVLTGASTRPCARSSPHKTKKNIDLYFYQNEGLPKAFPFTNMKLENERQSLERIMNNFLLVNKKNDCETKLHPTRVYSSLDAHCGFHLDHVLVQHHFVHTCR